MSHRANYAYIRMALGLSFNYSQEDGEDDIFKAAYSSPLCECTVGGVVTFDYVWTGDELVEQICKAWRITRERFVRSMAAPKPSPIAHSIFNDELRKFCGEMLPPWPSGRGLIIPKWNGRQIEAIKFFSLHEILKPKTRIVSYETN